MSIRYLVVGERRSARGNDEFHVRLLTMAIIAKAIKQQVDPTLCLDDYQCFLDAPVRERPAPPQLIDHARHHSQ
jgi:hypothetical protein